MNKKSKIKVLDQVVINGRQGVVMKIAEHYNPKIVSYHYGEEYIDKPYKKFIYLVRFTKDGWFGYKTWESWEDLEYIHLILK